MKARIGAVSVTSSLCLVATLLFSADLSPNRTPVAGETGPLRKQVKELEVRIKALEERVKQLEAKSGPVGVVPSPGPPGHPPGVRIIPPPQPGPPSPPKIWGQGECNGWSYYVIPLSGR